MRVCFYNLVVRFRLVSLKNGGFWFGDVCFAKNLLTSIVVFMAYSAVMSIIWLLLESPDLAITEAAVGAGVTSVLFFVTLKKIHAMDDRKDTEDEQD